MQAESAPFVIYSGGATARNDGAPLPRELQALWFAIARLRWTSVVIVPADHGGSAADVATTLAQVGTQLRETPVTAIVANRIDYSSARMLADLRPPLNDGGPRPAAVAVEASPVAPRGTDPVQPTRILHAAPLPPVGQAIIAIQPILDEPLGIAVAQAADAVVLCVRMGKSRLKAARRTVGLIGAERVIGSVLVP